MKHVVGVADMKMSSVLGDTIVTHGLGSCLGITAYDPVTQIGGLVHVMMPVSSTNPEKAEANPFMFVDTGVPAFLERLTAVGAVRSRCKLKIAGGAMLNGNDHFAIGKKNYVMLKKVLWKCGVLIDAQDVGGSMARTLYLSIGTGRVWISKNGQQQEL